MSNITESLDVLETEIILEELKKVMDGENER